MAIEIERKFRVRDGRWRGAVTRSIRMAQGYLGGERCSIRVRFEDAEARLNIKARERGAARLEFEYAIPVADAEVLLQSFAGALVEKTRHLVPFGDLTVEVDEFSGVNSGLVIAEIELPSVDHALTLPAWLGEEVTDEMRYYNAELARVPYSTWLDRARLDAEFAQC